MNGARHPGRPGPAPVPDTPARVAEPGSYQGDRDQTRHAQTQGKYGCISRAGPLASPADTGKADKASLRSVRDFARKEWPLRGSTTSRSAIADRRHLSGGTSAGGHALWSQTGRGSATATVVIRSPYSCWLQRREWAPYSPQGTRHLRPLPAPPPVCIRRCPAIPTSTIFCRSETSKLLVMERQVWPAGAVGVPGCSGPTGRCRVRAFARGLLGIWRPFGSFAGRRVTYGPAQVVAGG
jgi:hypothetical protein